MNDNSEELSSDGHLEASDSEINDRGYSSLSRNDNFRYLRPPGYKPNRKRGISSDDESDPEPTMKQQKRHKSSRDVIAGAKIRPFPEGLGPSERRNEWTLLKQQLSAIIRLKPSLKSQQQKLDFLVAEGGREILKGLNSKPAATEITNATPNPVFDNAIKRLDAHFHTGTNVVTDIIRFRNLAQQKNEPFIDFVHRLQQHAAVCEFGAAEENEIILQIRQTATNKEKLTEMMTRETKTLSEIINYGSCLDSEETFKVPKQEIEKEAQLRTDDAMVAANFSRGAYAHRGPSRGRYNYRGQSRGNHRGSMPFRGSRGNLRPPYYNQPDQRAKCYNCGKPGHIARNCTSVAFTKEEKPFQNPEYVWED